MNDHHRQMKLALELAQETEQASDLRSVIFIELMQADQRIQNQQYRLERLDGVSQALTVGG
jgi:hypothetical protein